MAPPLPRRTATGLSAAAAALLLAWPLASRAAPEPPASGSPGALVPLAEPAGQQLLMRASDRSDHGALAQWLETQANLGFCGVASAAMALNSLAVPAPPVPGYAPYRFWTQTNVFSLPGSANHVRPEVVAREGMTLAQLQGWLAGSPHLQVGRIHGDQLSLEQWRALLRRTLRDPQDRLLVNYHRSALGQTGAGHISPVAAYDPGSDRVLILDVARYRHPSVWVSSEVLWRAMRTRDSGAGRSRGLLLIRRTD
jgi:hypothetical protein